MIILYKDSNISIRAKKHEDGWHIFDDECEYTLVCRYGQFNIAFKSIVPSIGQNELVATICREKKSKNKKDRWGAIIIDRINKTYKYSISPTDKYDYIDGFDHGIARAHSCQADKWGIIDYNDKIIQKFIYNDIWEFYAKNYKIIRAEIDGRSVEIDLEHCILERKKLNPLDLKSQLTEFKGLDVQNFSKISFNNFKKFANFPEIDTSGNILFFVGKNNAGKSSFFAATRLVLANIRKLHFTQRNRLFFSFSDENNDDRQLKSFERYKCKNADSSTISFSVTIGDCRYTFLISSSQEIILFEIYHKINKVRLEYRQGGIIILNIQNDGQNDIRIEKNINDKELNFSRERTKNRHALELISSLFNSIDINRFVDKKELDDDVLNYNIDSKFDSMSEKIKKSLGDFCLNAMYCVESVHIPLFLPLVLEKTIGPKCNNYFLYECVKQYKKIETPETHEFIKKWMYRMGIGNDFIIDKKKENNLGESYYIYIISIIDSNNQRVDLRDLGSGSIHFLLLSFKLLSIIYGDNTGRFAPIIEIEEPEQNLHPKFQSHLASFFLDLSNSYKKKFSNDTSKVHGLKLLIETHSEYMIRRSQVLVKQLFDVGFDLKYNPFRTYYFPTEDKLDPYDMVYKNDGHFEREFGHGFTDESSILAMQIL